MSYLHHITALLPWVAALELRLNESSPASATLGTRSQVKVEDLAQRL